MEQGPTEDRRPPVPPFTAATAAAKARAAEDAWNTRDPLRVAGAYTVDTWWRNRAEFLHGRDAVIAFLQRKWARELDYRLIKEVWRSARIGSPFASSMNGTTGPASGSARMATSNGRSRRPG